MRFSGSHSADKALLSSILFPTLIAAVGNINCRDVVVNSKKFDFGGLEGPHSVMHSINGTEAFFNTTYTLDLCKPLQRSKDVKKGKECPAGTRVCAIEHHIIKESGEDIIEDVIPIAGELGNHGGYSLDAQWTLLSASPSHHDSEREGLRLEMGGGPKHARADDTNKKQKAIVEFICDRNRTGLEGEMTQDKYYEKRAETQEGDETKDGEKDGEKDDEPKEGDGKDEKEPSEVEPSLKFLKYDTSGEEYDILRLEWTTRYACENYTSEKPDEAKKESWGFFTWFIIIAFMATAAYLIFGSWLNYNRYGARGWDLLPHGDTIRDVPYLMKDWTRRVVNTIQGGGSRGGYSAV